MLGFTFLPTQRVRVKLIKGEKRDLIKSIGSVLDLESVLSPTTRIESVSGATLVHVSDENDVIWQNS